MTFKDFYKPNNISESEWIKQEKNILLIVPDKKHDLSGFLSKLGLTKYEVAVTWPKEKVDMLSETCVAKPKLVIQVDCQLSKKFISVKSDAELPLGLEDNVRSVLADTFVSLHHHDEFSIKDGLGTVDNLLKLLKAQRRSFCAITNHGSVGGWIRQYNACKKAGIKAIFGIELYISNYRGDDPELKKANRSANHLVLLAQTKEGFDNIIRIHNDAQLHGFYYTPRANREALEKWGKGIIGMSACFIPGTLVQTNRGPVEIENIRDSDLILTHKARWVMPEKTFRIYDGYVKKIKTNMFGFDTTSTDSHEFLVVKLDNQKRTNSKRLAFEKKYFDISKMVVTDRRREFKAEWTSNIESGDWVLYPVDSRIHDIKMIDLSYFNRGREVKGMVGISKEGRKTLKEMRKKCGKTIRDVGFQKCSVYRREKCESPIRLSILKEYLRRIGVDGDKFVEKYCFELMSSDVSALRKPIKKSVLVNGDFLFLLGAYCAEGSCTRSRAIWTIHKDEINFRKMICRAIRKCFGIEPSVCIREQYNRTDIVCCSTAMAIAMGDLCGVGCVEKRVPDFVFELPFEKQQHFVRGLIMGDGSYVHKERKYGSRITNDGIVFTTVSEKLAQGLIRILLRRNIVPVCCVIDERIDKKGVKHRRSFNISIYGSQAKPLIDFVFKKRSSVVFEPKMYFRKNLPISVAGHDYFTIRVKSVERKHFKGEVRCLSIPEDNSFVAGMCVVHNCQKGEISQALMAGENDKAKEIWEFYSKVFDQFCIELQIIECEEQREVNRRLISFAQEVGAPLVLSNDSHYLEPEHAETHDLLLCSRQGKTVLDKLEDKADVWNFDVRNLYYRDAAAMRVPFEEGFVERNSEKRLPFRDDVFTEDVFQQAMANTLAIARETEDIVLDSSIKLPKLYADGQAVLQAKVNAGFKALGLDKKSNAAEYRERATREFRVITKMGWTDYFLIMERIISDTVEKYGEWAVGYGRGSAAGSLVSYCLRLTDVDPLEWGLLFERFLDESREKDPPDIDTDFDPRVRDWVKKHIVELFGVDNVCSIGTYQTYRTRAVILDVARVLALDLGEASNVTKRIDPLKSFEDDEGEDTKVDKLDFDEICSHYPELKAYFEAHPEVRHHAEILRNQVKNMGTHAGGVIISDNSLKDRIPVLYDKPSNEDRQVISAWAESGNTSELSAVGLVKYDILGLNNLPVISDCIALIEKTKGIKIHRKEIPINDREAILVGSKNDLVGIFQLENPSTKEVIEKVGMESLNDVSAITSLIRPGPKDMGMDMEYAERKHGKPYEMPEFLKPLLAETYGVLTYQEDFMRISRVLSGFTSSEANKLRKAAGKKLPELMAQMKDKFIKGAQPRIDAKEITLMEVEQIWNLIESFAKYGFCKAHSVAYSAISTVELWLKHNYPVEFITALINNTKLGKKKHGSEDILVDYVNYARRNGIEVKVPDINSSGEEFRIEDGAIRFSIGHVKNVASAAPVIISFQPFTSMEDFYNRVKMGIQAEVVIDEPSGDTPSESEKDQDKKPAKKPVARRPNKKVVESLIAAGAFNCFGSRNEVMAEYYRLRKDKKEEPPQHDDDKWVKLEKEIIGLCLSSPPLYVQYDELIKKNKWKLISEVDGSKKKIKVFGMIESVKPHTSKNGNAMYIVNLTDGVDTMMFYVFQGGQQFFRDHFKVGTIGAVPMSKFDEGDTRFFDDRGEVEVL